MSLPDGVRRRKVPVVNSKQRDDNESNEIRVYFSTNTPPMPSVSVVKGLRVDPEKEAALEGWRNCFDGKSSWGRPWWKDQKAFKAFRGTLIHFAILNALGDAAGDTYFHTIGDKNWGLEEYYAEYVLKKWSKKAPSANTNEISYVPRENKYDGEHAWDRAVRDMKWSTEAFKKHVIDDGPLSQDKIIGVEEYIFDTEYGYGGQFDLLYTDDNGRVILSDLKTSSAIRFDHKIQSAAYRRAVEAQQGIDVDETEIIRVDPDSEEVVISRSHEWDRSLEGLEHEFLALAYQAWETELSETLSKAKELIESEHAQSYQAELDVSSGASTAD